MVTLNRGNQRLELHSMVSLSGTNVVNGIRQPSIVGITNLQGELRNLLSLHLAKANYRGIGREGLDFMIGERGMPGNYVVYFGKWNDGVTNS